MDGHCRVVPGYMQSMINMIANNGYKTIVTPIVTDVNGTTWEHKSMSGGSKMMFEWNFEFYWFEDNNDEVPIAVGGIQLMTKRWWTESGGYDQGMLDWGGENIEQSLRVWMCGGKILVDRNAKIGHIFERPAPKNKVRSGQVQRNHARAGFLYLDDKLDWFMDNHASAAYEMTHNQMGPHIGDRLAVRHSLQCKSFEEGFMDRFWSVFENQGLLLDQMHMIRHKESGLCLALIRTTKEPRVKDVNAMVELRFKACNPGDNGMIWTRTHSGTRVYNKKYNRCLDRGNKPFGREQLIAYGCDEHQNNMNQKWYWENNRIYSPSRPVTSFRAHAVKVDENSEETLCIVGPEANGKQLEVPPEQAAKGSDLVKEANQYPLVYMEPCRPRPETDLMDPFEFETI
ncbi:hypothetical protein FOL47_007445 [Perkinsus chesapeaki]|uniref:Galactosyltransferase C-terminal domain-containing protein n=1 Tax=Perkinsus chesapeaki TaxID=330153 RepID=A0A7J6MVU9_PERCH|nr:hypothetical protein FOL47_007445 [Perkinsus chesapeaki]